METSRAVASPPDTEPVTAVTRTPLTSWKRWRRRLKRLGYVVGTIVLVAYLIVWWVALRIVEKPSWPPPADAVTSEEAEGVTEAFAARENPARDDVAIAYAPTTASDVQFFLDGTEFFPAMLADIEGAQDSIHLQMFGITRGQIADTFTNALIRKAQAGVDVRLIVDFYGAKVDSQSKPYFDAMSEAGVDIVVNNVFPPDRDGEYGHQSIDWRQDEVGKSDHRKAMVVDGLIGWVGGGGLEDHFNGGTFHDAFTRVEGNIVRQMQAVFLTSFCSYGGTLSSAPGSLERYFPAPPDPGAIRTTLLQNIPGGFVPATQASRAIIENATTRLDIMNPYFTDPGMMDRIVDAAKRGVHVRLLVSQRTNNVPADAALKYQYPRLLDAGVEIWEYPVTMHAKVTVADNAMIVGTINYDAWALYRNLEIGLLFEDATTADRGVDEYVVPDIAMSRPGETPSGTINRIKGWFWDKLVYFI